MPFSIRKSGNKFQVVNQQTGKVHGTFDTRGEADQQLKALYANVPDAQKKELDIMQIATKSIGMELVPVDEPADAYPGSFHAIVSSPRRDRDGDQLWADEWEQPLPDHIVINGDHDNNHIMSIIGSGTPTLESDQRIHVRGTYAETDYAQNARKLAKPGKNGEPAHLKTLSCAYREKRGEKGVRRELVNASFVVVPSNVDCVVVESKSHDLQIETNIPDKPPTPLDVANRNDVVKSFVALTTKELQAMTPDQRVQAIHDMASELGSVCAGNAGSPVEMKSTEPESITVGMVLDPEGPFLFKSDDGKYVVRARLSQAPEAPPKEADHEPADQAKAFELAKLKAQQITMGTRYLDDKEIEHAQ